MSPLPTLSPIRISAALRRAFARGYDAAAFRADLLAGVVVGIIALPLSMALAIAVGVPPERGLYTAIVAGSIVAVAGGSKFQITGPTAAFIVILAPIVTQHGIAGLLTAGFMAGLILVAMGIARLGRLIEFIPHPVTTGFTAGIATVIATLQIKDVLGLSLGNAKMPDAYVDKVAALWAARHTASLAELGVAAATLALLIGFPKITRRVPAPLVAITVLAVAAALVHRAHPAFTVATIQSRFNGIPAHPPAFALPWGGAPLSLATLRALLPSAFAIAVLGAIESLLSAVIADGMTGTRHDPNAELLGLGLGNVVAPFFGGIAATGALARTAANVRAGARSPISAVVHAAFVLVSIVVLAPLVGYVPMASLAALLLVVAWNMSEVRHFGHIVKVAPKSDVVVLLVCYGLTVVFDMVLAVGTGVVLAALLFMGRMAELTQGRAVLDADGTETSRALPRGVLLYEIAGPLFFGAAQNAMGAIDAIHADVTVVVLDLGRVSTIDATGLVALESAITRLFHQQKRVVIAGPLPRPDEVFAKSEVARLAYILPTREAAIELAVQLAAVPPSEHGPPSRSRIPPTPTR